MPDGAPACSSPSAGLQSPSRPWWQPSRRAGPCCWASRCAWARAGQVPRCAQAAAWTSRPFWLAVALRMGQHSVVVRSPSWGCVQAMVELGTTPLGYNINQGARARPWSTSSGWQCTCSVHRQPAAQRCMDTACPACSSAFLAACLPSTARLIDELHADHAPCTQASPGTRTIGSTSQGAPRLAQQQPSCALLLVGIFE